MAHNSPNTKSIPLERLILVLLRIDYHPWTNQCGHGVVTLVCIKNTLFAWGNRDQISKSGRVHFCKEDRKTG